MRGSSSHRGRESPPVPGALRDLHCRIAFAMRGTAPDSLRIRSGCSWPKRLRFDVEINAPQHFVVLDFAKHPFSVVSRGHAESPDIPTFELDELLATKMETIYRAPQWPGSVRSGHWSGTRAERCGANRGCVMAYIDREGSLVTCPMSGRNLAGKIGDPQFNAGLSSPLRPGFERQPKDAARAVSGRLTLFLPAEP